MSLEITFLTVLGAVTVLLVGVVAFAGAPSSKTGRVMAVAALAVLPLLVTARGALSHLDRATSTEFCLSCHEMDVYGKSLHMDDPSSVVAVHYQNRYVPRDKACFACHTSYTMFGDFQAKIRGMQHVVAHYLGPKDAEITLYEPYNNRECLYCHENARRFEESVDHVDLREDLASGELSCLDCHDVVHRADEVDGLSPWTGPSGAGEAEAEAEGEDG